MKNPILSAALFSLLLQNANAQTFYEDIAPIIYERCTQCHRPCSSSALPLITYSDCSGNAALIQTVINGGSHASWVADTNCQHYQHEPFLSSSEISAINSWISNGTPQGNPNNAPPGPVYGNESFIDNPDAVLTMSQHYTVPNDNLNHCEVFVIPTGFVQEKFVRALEFNLCTLKDVHHASISVDTTGSIAQRDAMTPGYGLERDSIAASNPSRLLTIFHPGDRAELFPPGNGYRIPAGADLILEVHFLPITISTDDSISINVFFDDTTVHNEVGMLTIDEEKIMEPYFILPKDHIEALHHQFQISGSASFLSVSPQLDLLGKEMDVFAVSNSNDTTCLVRIHTWDPSLQKLYYFTAIMGVDSGATIFSRGVFDNTTDNPNNPDDPPLNVDHNCFTCDDDFKIYFQYVGSESINAVSDCFFSFVSEEEVSQKGIVIQPNPANDQLEISFMPDESSIASIDLFSATGTVIRKTFQSQVQEGSHSITLNVRDFPSGIYLCRINGRNYSSLSKFVVQH